MIHIAASAPPVGTAPSEDWGVMISEMFKLLSLVVGGLGIFLLGMKNMSEGFQAIAGAGLRKMIASVTNHRILAAGVGTAVTCVVQSSSVTTVMVVGFVNSGLMTLTQAIGVIMGANVGTTITGWILVLKIGKFGLPILGVAAFFYLFARRDRWRYTAMAVMGIGMIFFGLLLMKDGVGIIKEQPAFEQAFSWFTADSYFGVLKCAMIGCLMTVLVQSSSATLGITIALATGGVIEFETAAALILGENIGTTITALLASIGTTTNAKRAAYFHVIFNIAGVLWITALFHPYLHVIQWVREVFWTNSQATSDAEMTASIALVHSGFNVTNTLLFLPFVRVFARFLERFVPDRQHKEKPHLTRLDVRMLETPIIGLEQSRVEVIRMGDGVEKIMNWVSPLLKKKTLKEAEINRIFQREDVLDSIQHEVMNFITSLLAGNVPRSISSEASKQIRIADEYESISDVQISILKAHLRVQKADLEFSDKQLERLADLHETVSDYLRLVTDAYKQKNIDVRTKAHTLGNTINHRVREVRLWHVEQLGEQKCDPLISMQYTAMLQSYRHIKDHALNIAQAVSGER